MQMRSLMYAMRTLEAGFTTVRDVGSSEQEMYAMRDAINNGWIDGPRIIAAGGVGITGGHADISGVQPELMEHWTGPNVCDGPYDCRRAARNVIKYGGDLIKITSTGGVMTDRATGTGQQMEMDELREVVLAAERMGRKVASHAHHEDGIVAALLAGVASIEHGSYTGDRAIPLFLETGAYLEGNCRHMSAGRGAGNGAGPKVSLLKTEEADAKNDAGSAKPKSNGKDGDGAAPLAG